MDYHDFELRIGARREGVYPVAVKSRAGEEKAQMAPFDRTVLGEHLQAVEQARGLGEQARGDDNTQRDLRRSGQRAQVEHIQERLTLNGAIRLQPLQVMGCIESAGDRLTALHSVLLSDTMLLDQARSPLMLNITMKAYQYLTEEDLQSEEVETTAARRKHLFDTYMDRMFRRAGVRTAEEQGG